MSRLAALVIALCVPAGIGLAQTPAPTPAPAPAPQLDRPAFDWQPMRRSFPDLRGSPFLLDIPFSRSFPLGDWSLGPPKFGSATPSERGLAACPECLPAQRAAEDARAREKAAFEEVLASGKALQDAETDVHIAESRIRMDLEQLDNTEWDLTKLRFERPWYEDYLPAGAEEDRLRKNIDAIKNRTRDDALARDKAIEALHAAGKKDREAHARWEAARQAVSAAYRSLEACNRERCEGVSLLVDTVVGVFGTNPFNPDNPVGAPATGSAPGGIGTLQFSSPTYAGGEGQGSVTITVTRSGGTSGAVTVQYFTGPASATAGSDYQASNGALSWADGDAGAKVFTLPIIDDTAVEGPETFFVTLDNPTGGATLGGFSTSTVTIADNDTAPSGPCGQTGSAWQPNTGAAYSCSGTCSPSPSPQTLTVGGDRVTLSPFHAGGAATFTGCASTLNSDSGTLTYFGQANHRATITRFTNNSYNANIVSSGGGTCSFSCSRSGP